MKVIRHPRHADRVMRAEGALAVSGVVGGVLLWAEAWHFGGYGFAAAAFVGLLGVNAGVRALRNYNRWRRGADGEESVQAALQLLPDHYYCVTNFVVPNTHQGDTDLLILGPFGVLAIEVKSYTGHYACQGDSWFCLQRNGGRTPLHTSISRQVKRSRKAVQHYLVDREIAVPVYAAAVFPASTLLELSQANITVLRADALADYILALPTAVHPPIQAADWGDVFAVRPARVGKTEAWTSVMRI